MSNPKDYTVGWICALSDLEKILADFFLTRNTKGWSISLLTITKNDYTLRQIGKQNVVIARSEIWDNKRCDHRAGRGSNIHESPFWPDDRGSEVRPLLKMIFASATWFAKQKLFPTILQRQFKTISLSESIRRIILRRFSQLRWLY
ncbi:hypothetical protein B0J11DRAFT_26636 [Dendryphion nanum]|uniref:Uncharacterized protein n=1 Tax=Dendryphion nanum TaxID=256645 RepID=A0A9P9J2D8_9PLEO|nr:hypothetical protein B0J11DRAFT_26636 [Dendryphion nanum]